MKKWRERTSAIVHTTLSLRETKTLDNGETDNIKGKNTDTEDIKVKKKFGILIILTVAFLYILGLFFEMGDWLGSIAETVTFFVNGFSRVFFRSISHG